MPLASSSLTLQLHCGLTVIWYLGVFHVFPVRNSYPIKPVSYRVHSHPPVLSQACPAAPSLFKETVCLSVCSSPSCPSLWQSYLLGLLSSWSDPWTWLKHLARLSLAPLPLSSLSSALCCLFSVLGILSAALAPHCPKFVLYLQSVLTDPRQNPSKNRDIITQFQARTCSEEAMQGCALRTGVTSHIWPWSFETWLLCAEKYSGVKSKPHKNLNNYILEWQRFGYTEWDKLLNAVACCFSKVCVLEHLSWQNRLMYFRGDSAV